MNDLDRRMTAFARTRYGIVTDEDLIHLGYTRKMMRSREAKGLLVQEYPGVYVVGGVPLPVRGRLMAAHKWLGGKVVVSHRSAAGVWGLEGFDPGLIEMTSSSPRRSVNGVHIHYSRTLPHIDVRHLSDFPLTKLERTLIDLGEVVSPERVEAALDSALFLRQTTFHRVADRVEQTRGRGRKGPAVLGAILSERDPDRAPAESIRETAFYRWLMRSPIPHPDLQHQVFDDDGFVGRLDAAWPIDKVGIEAHSLRWHSPRARVKRDAARHNRLTALGWRILYVTYQALDESPRAILRQLERLLYGTD